MITMNELVEADIVWDSSEEEENLPTYYMVNMNDFFYWGCADGENVTEEYLPEIDKVIIECNGSIIDGVSLWVCRKRNMRPQGAFYSYIDKTSWPLFDLAGPEREVGLGNPYAPGAYKRR